MRAVIDNLMTTPIKSLHDCVFQLNSAVIGPNSNSNGICTHKETPSVRPLEENGKRLREKAPLEGQIPLLPYSLP